MPGIGIIKRTRAVHAPRLAAGWREWVALPELGVAAIKAKLDTGARSSSLHSKRIERFTRNGAEHVRVLVEPGQRLRLSATFFEAPVVDERIVTDSGGHRERRIVIVSALSLGNSSWPIEITLTNREDMRFRLLLGRTALAGRLTVDPARSYLLGKRKRPPSAAKQSGEAFR